MTKKELPSIFSPEYLSLTKNRKKGRKKLRDLERQRLDEMLQTFVRVKKERKERQQQDYETWAQQVKGVDAKTLIDNTRKKHTDWFDEPDARDIYDREAYYDDWPIVETYEGRLGSEPVPKPRSRPGKAKPKKNDPPDEPMEKRKRKYRL